MKFFIYLLYYNLPNEIVTIRIHTVLPPVALAPRNLIAVQEGLSSVRVSWNPPTSLGDTTGYRISYSGGSSGSVDISDGLTSTHTLTGLQNEDSYTISVVGTSPHFFSNPLSYYIELIKGKMIITVRWYVLVLILLISG